MAGGGENSAQGSGVSDDPGFVTSVLSPLMRVVGLGIASRGGALGPMLASGGDFIAQAREDRLRRDVYANIMPAMLQGVTRSREMAPGVPGKPAQPGTPDVNLPFLAGVVRPRVPMMPADEPAQPQADGANLTPPAQEYVTADGQPTSMAAPYEIPLTLPGRAATPATPDTPPDIRTWQTGPTMAEAIARLQERGGPESTRAITMQALAKMGLPSLEQVPPEVTRGTELAQQQALEAKTRSRQAPIFTAASRPGATSEDIGAAAAEMGRVHIPTPMEQLQLQSMQQQRALGPSIADRLEAEAQRLGVSLPPPVDFPQAQGLPPFSVFQQTPEQRANRMRMVAAAARAGDLGAIAEAQKLLGAPAMDIGAVQHYATAAHQLRPPEIALTAERVKHIASGEIVDPRLSQAGALKIIAEEQKRAVEVAGAKATATAQGRDAGTPGITPDALDLAADNYLTTRQLPAMGMGGVTQRVRIMNRAAQLAQERGIAFNDIPARQATFKAAQTELSQLQAQRGKIMAFADTADKNLDLALQMSARVPRTGIPQLNSWLQTGQTKWTGDPALAGFAAATRVGINETAKVTSGQVSGVSTDAARKEIENMLNTAQTPDAFREVVETLRLDMANRKAGYMRQIDEIHSSMRSLSGAPQASGSGAPPAGAAAPPPPPGGSRQVRVRDPKTGRTGTATLAPGQSLPAGVEEIR